jgi:uncharacterized protein
VSRAVVLDTGPLVALLIRQDPFHQWATQTVQSIVPPLLTCEAVLTEAMFLMRQIPGGRAAVMEMVNDGYLTVAFHASEHVEPLLRLIQRYDNVPMSLADACLVRMAELHPRSEVFTLDSDFQVYRKHGRGVIDTISPW